METLKATRNKSDNIDGDAGVSDTKEQIDTQAAGHKTDCVETERLRDAYADVQRRYDLLEDSILYSQRQKFEAQMADRESLNSKLFETKEVVEKLRERLKRFEDRHAQHLEERARNREMIDNLRSKLKDSRKTGSANQGDGHIDRARSAKISKKDYDGLKARLSAVQNDIRAMQRSWSWRTTAPLRFLKRLFRA